jgi:hypothetical protein
MQDSDLNSKKLKIGKITYGTVTFVLVTERGKKYIVKKLANSGLSSEAEKEHLLNTRQPEQLVPKLACNHI